MYRISSNRDIKVSFELSVNSFNFPPDHVIHGRNLQTDSTLIYLEKQRELCSVAPLNSEGDGKFVLTPLGEKKYDKYKDLGAEVSIVVDKESLNKSGVSTTFKEIISLKNHKDLGFAKVHDKTILRHKDSDGKIKFFLLIKRGETIITGMENSSEGNTLSLEEDIQMIELGNYETLRYSLKYLRDVLERESGLVHNMPIECHNVNFYFPKGEWSVYKHLHQAMNEDEGLDDVEDLFKWNVKPVYDTYNNKYGYALNDKNNDKVDIINTMFVGHHLIKDDTYKRETMDYDMYNIRESLGRYRVVTPEEILVYAEKRNKEAKLKAEREKLIAKRKESRFKKL